MAANRSGLAGGNALCCVPNISCTPDARWLGSDDTRGLAAEDSLDARDGKIPAALERVGELLLVVVHELSVRHDEQRARHAQRGEDGPGAWRQRVGRRTHRHG